MHKQKLSVTYTEPCHIFHPKRKQFWQCGVWVDSVNDATTYCDKQEAQLVMGLRSLYGCEIVDA